MIKLFNQKTNIQFNLLDILEKEEFQILSEKQKNKLIQILTPTVSMKKNKK